MRGVAGSTADDCPKRWKMDVKNVWVHSAQDSKALRTRYFLIPSDTDKSKHFASFGNSGLKSINNEIFCLWLWQSWGLLYPLVADSNDAGIVQSQEHRGIR